MSRRAVATLAIALLGFLTFLSFREFRADIASLEADTVIRVWNEQGIAPSLAEWNRALQLLVQANELSDRSAVFLERLGYWHSAELVGKVGAVVPPDVALQYFKEALLKRPTSAYTWANLAQAKYQLGQVDKEFYVALQQADRLGPWEPWVQVAVVDLGLALWDESPDQARQLTIAALQRGILRNSPEMMKLIHKRGRLSQICGLEFAQKAGLPGCKKL